MKHEGSVKENFYPVEVTCTLTLPIDVMAKDWEEAKEKAMEEFEEAATSPFCDPEYTIVLRKDNE